MSMKLTPELKGLNLDETIHFCKYTLNSIFPETNIHNNITNIHRNNYGNSRFSYVEILIVYRDEQCQII